MKEWKIEEYIHERVEPTLKWYELKAQQARKMGLVIQVYQLTFLLIIPVMLLSGEMFFSFSGYLTNMVASLLAVFAAIFTVLINYRKYDTKWEQYRYIAEQLKREMLSYRMSLGEYENLEGNKKDKIFVEKAESILSQELSRWFAGEKGGISDEWKR